MTDRLQAKADRALRQVELLGETRESLEKAERELQNAYYAYSRYQRLFAQANAEFNHAATEEEVEQAGKAAYEVTNPRLHAIGDSLVKLRRDDRLRW